MENQFEIGYLDYEMWNKNEVKVAAMLQLQPVARQGWLKK